MYCQIRKTRKAKWLSASHNSTQGVLHALRKRLGLLPPSPSAQPCPIESLEPRQLLAAAPLISEFMASNDHILADKDGDYSDWIEIQNPGSSALNLTGYYLTDDPTQLNKWRFPSTTLAPGGYIVVFASDKDLAVAGQQLHTNFSLDAGGEYLALVAPDGSTIVSEYGPQYPAQLQDISYGRTTDQIITSLIGPRATARTRVPTVGPLPANWTALNFDDSAWTSGATGIGYETQQTVPQIPGFTVKMIDTTTADIYDIGIAESILNGAAPADSITSIRDYASFNLGTGGQFGNDQALPNGATPDSDQNAPQREQYVLRATANVTIPAGQWTINVNSDDGFLLKIPGVTFLNRYGEEFSGATNPSPADTLVYGTPRGPSDTWATFTVPTALKTTIQLDCYERGGGDEFELAIASGYRSSVDSSFQLLSDGLMNWSVKTTSSTPPPSYKDIIGTDLQSQMQANNSALIRIPFSAEDPKAFDTLKLRMKYDDGFVAYLNGQEVARRNAPSSLLWNSSATATHPDDQALVYEDIDLSPYLNLLQTGNNVLAIQGLNKSDDLSDFLIYPELQGIRTLANQDRYFTTPTPGNANLASSISGIVADTKFDHDRGFYDAPFQLAITCATPGAEIRYTLDGTVPTATTGLVYTGPITISKTTSIRAAAFKAGYLNNDSDTQSYIFINDVIRQAANGQAPAGWPASWGSNVVDYGMDPDVVNNPAYATSIKTGLTSIPTYSITMDLKDLFDPSTGIYANPGGDGQLWERLASIELINPDGSKGFQINGGIRIRGGYSRSNYNPKHGFHLFFRNDPGYGGELNYPIFGPDGASVFDRFDLRSAQNYSWSFDPGSGNGISIRDQLNRDMQLAMGDPGAHGNFVHLYINGMYWGLYDTDERPSASNAANVYGGNEDEYDVIKVDPDLSYCIEPLNGNLDAWTNLWTQLRGNMSNLANYMKVQGLNPDGTRNPNYPVLLDVDNLIDYMLVIFYGGNLDAPLSNFLSNTSPNNFFAIRNRNGNEGFKFFVHDAEHTFLDVNQDRTGPYNTIPSDAASSLSKSNPQYMFQLLEASPEFKLRVADRIHKFMFNDGVLTPNGVRTLFLKRKNEIDTAIVDESARWGDAKRSTPYTRNVEWTTEINRLLNSYIPQRTGIVLSQLKNDGLYPTLAAPEYNKNGGTVSSGFSLTISGTSTGTVYYTLDGSDPRLPGGAVSPAAKVYSSAFPLTQTATVRTRILNNGKWSALTEATFTFDMSALRITELMYNPAPPPAGSPFVKDDFEFVELTNTGSSDLDLAGVKFTNGIDFTFPSLILAPGQRTVLVKNKDAFQSRYGTQIPIAGIYTGSLSNGGETIRLEGALGQLIEEFTYNNSWYPHTDAGGFSLIPLDPNASNATLSDKSGWRPSDRLNGNPAAADTGLAPNSIVINEILAHTDQPSGDWIELYNTTDQPLDISGWFLSDSSQDLSKYQIPAGTVISAHGYVVLNQRDHFGLAGNPGVNVPFAFSELGEAAYLSSSYQGQLGGYRDSVDFAASDREVTLGRHLKSTGGSDFVPLSSPTPAAANASPLVGPVVINEIMYAPPTSGTEYIELKNVTGSDVRLYDPLHPENTWSFTAGITFSFPSGASIPAYGYALIVPIAPELFRSQYNIPANVPIYGPYTGSLDNAGEKLELSKPGDPELNGFVPYYQVDRVNYQGTAPWPTTPNGTGVSLARVDSLQYGNDVANWAASSKAGGSPGIVNFDFTPPTAVVNVPATNPGPIDALTLQFSEPIVGLELSDLTLRRYADVLPWNAGVSLRSTDGQTWILSGLSELTQEAGAYTLSLVAQGSGIADLYSNALANDIQGGFTNSRLVMSDSSGGLSLLKVNGAELQIYRAGQPSQSMQLSDLRELDLSGGTFRIDGQLATAGGSLTVQIHGDAANPTTVLLTESQQWTSLTLTGAATLNLKGSDKLLKLSSLNLDPEATLDLANNDLILTATPQTKAAALAALSSAIQRARGTNGQWLGSGVGSSAANANKQTGLAILLNDKNGKPLLTTFAGQSVTENDILVKYTWNGDVNIDGKVDAADYFLVDSGFITQQGQYRNGDLNFDGAVDAADYFLIDSAFIAQTGPLSAEEIPAPIVATPLLPTAVAKPQLAPSVLQQLFSVQPIL